MKHLILDLFTAFLAVVVGMLYYRRLNVFYKLLIIQTFFYIIVDVTAVFVGHNEWVFNLQIPIEAGLLLSAAHAYFKSPSSKLVLLILFSVLIIAFCIDVFYLADIEKIAFHALIAEGLLLSGIYITVLFSQFIKTNNKPVDAALAIACIGMILYFSVSIPYISMISSLKEDPTQNQLLFTRIVVVLGDIRYLFIAIAFFIAGRAKTQSPVLIK